MAKKWLLVFIIVVQLISLSGCWDYKDIDKLDFPAAGAYDLHQASKTADTNQEEEEQTVDLTTIIPNISENVKEPFRIETTSGLTIGNAREPKVYSDPGTYSPGVSGVIIFGEDLAASTGLKNVVESLSRAPQTPKTQEFTIAEGRGESILRVPIKDYPSMADYIEGLLRQSHQRGFIPDATLHEFKTNIAPGKNPIMPLLTIKGEKVEVAGAAIFKKGRMIGKANLNETPILMMLRGIKSTGNIPFIIKKDGKMFDKGSVDIKNSRKVKVERNGDDFTFQITIILEGSLAEHQTDKLFTKNEDLRKMIEDQIAADVTEDSKKFIKKMQEEYQVDCIDISKYALAKWRKELKDKVDEDFIGDVNIKVEVKMKLNNVGELT
ncbi:MAG: Ger(x)C family spore germination protein [Syntrophomonas sp.]|nr:Ger(x)C family spore germination protein [Syntrophomonas sp.]